MSGEPARAPEADEATDEETEKPDTAHKDDQLSIPNGNVGGDDPFVEKKRPVYMLQHHPSQRNVKKPNEKNPDLKL